MPRPLGDATREAFGKELVELGRAHSEVVVVDGDVNNSTFTNLFKKEFPDRFFQAGIAESNMVGIASGLASCGKVPFVSSFSVFLLNNAYEQLRMAVAYPEMNVKCVGTHAGISIGEDGPSQMATEDVALAGALGGFTVLVPADGASTRAAVRAAYALKGPVYIRCGRPKAPVVYSDGVIITPGRAITLREGNDVTLLANGLMVALALDAADTLSADGMQARVLDMASVKPLDRDAVVRAAQETGALVVSEEHLRHGGLGSVVAVAAASDSGVPIGFVDLGDRYAESGTPDELLRKYGLTADAIVGAAREAISRKKARSR